MDNLNFVVNNSKLPSQLKEYFTTSERVKDILDINLVRDIEDLYIFYNSLYTFDTSAFSAYVITSLGKCTNLEKFYHYLKKIIDTNLKLETKDKKTIDTNHRFYIDSNTANNIFVDVFNDFGQTVDTFHKGSIGNVNLIQTYKIIGKMELVNALIDDKDYKSLLSIGKNILNGYISCDGNSNDRTI